jgi:hypothetical protein
LVDHPVLEKIRNENPTLLPMIVLTLKRAHEEALAMITSSRMASRFWQEAFPQVLYPAVQQSILEMVEMLGKDEIEGKRELNAQKNHSHAEITLPWAVITVHALAENEQHPRKCVYRDKLSVEQFDFFDVIDGDMKSERSYFAIIHKRNKITNMLEDVRLISMNAKGEAGGISVSIMEESFPCEIVSKTGVVVVKEETIDQVNRPRLKRAK